jgi:molecular chaperone GrpE
MDENEEKVEEMDDTNNPLVEGEIVDSSSDVDEVEEFVFDEDGEEDLRATLKKLRKDLKQSQKEKLEYLTNWQRERADFQNFKKDELERGKRMVEITREKFIEDLLPVLDSYDMAFANKEAWEKVDKNWRMGVEYIHQQLLRTLADQGVSEIAPNIGDSFDLNMHQSIDTIPTDDESMDHTVANVLQKGYKSKDPSNSSGQAKILRPARVNVFAKG